jgi:hypothetical protein
MEIQLDPMESNESLAANYRKGEETRFLLFNESESVVAVVSDDWETGHLGMLSRYCLRQNGVYPVDDEEFHKYLREKLIGGGYINPETVKWDSSNCKKIFGTDRPEDEKRGSALLAELRAKFDAWIAAMPE